MRKMTFTLCAVLLFGASAFAVKVKVISNEAIVLPGNTVGYHPILSPKGDYLLFTGSDLKGLHKYDLATSELHTISRDKGAGFDAQVSDDGNFVVFRSQMYKDRLRYTGLKALDLNTGQETEIIEPSRHLESFSVKAGTVLAVEKGKLKTKQLSGKKLSKAPAVTSVKEGQLYLTRNKRTKALDVSGGQDGCLWASVSPDGKKLLYYAIGKGQAFVSNLDGSQPVSLGVIRAPKWLGNDWIVGMEDYDNGEVLTASKIILASADGKSRTALTNDSVIAINPSGTADASKILYNTHDGKVFLMTLEIGE